jgi:endogenous inhibitor of DNA gyrase (YacG/DUF329 family)
MNEMTRSEAARLLQQARTKMPGRCPVCGRAFEGYGGKESRAKRYCSDRCRFQAINERRKAERAKARDGLPPADLTTPPQPQEPP